MLRKFAVALLAATVLGAPAFAEGSSVSKATDKPAAAASTTAPKVSAKPTLKSAKVRKGHRHVVHAKHIKHVKHVNTAQSVYGAKHHVRHIARKPAPTVGSAAMSTSKPRSGTN